MDGSVKCCQSYEEPSRTIIALVKAAKVIVMAAMPAQTPVREAGELSSIFVLPPADGTPDRPPPEGESFRFSLFGRGIRKPWSP